MTTPRRESVANGLATMMLADEWTQPAMTRQLRIALGRSRPPVWARTLVAQVLDAYRDPPRDRPRELAAFLQTCPAWAKAWTGRRDRWPRIVHLAPVPTGSGERRWPTTRLDDLSALGRLLDVDQGELAWFADVRG